MAKTSKQIKQFAFKMAGSQPDPVQGQPSPYGASAQATLFSPSSDVGLGGYRTDYQIFSSGKKNTRPTKNKALTIDDKYNRQRLFTDIAFERGREDLNAQLGAVEGGYSRAENVLSKYGRSQKQTALDREQALAGELSASSGGKSYMQDYYRRALSNDTTRSLQAVDDQLAEMFSGLYVQGGLATGGILGNRASTYLQQADSYQSLLAQQGSEELGFAPGQSAAKDYSGFYNLIGSLAGAAGSYFGGGDGGGGSSWGYGGAPKNGTYGPSPT